MTVGNKFDLTRSDIYVGKNESVSRPLAPCALSASIEFDRKRMHVDLAKRYLFHRHGSYELRIIKVSSIN